jgi:hypothetical protein
MRTAIALLLLATSTTAWGQGALVPRSNEIAPLRRDTPLRKNEVTPRIRDDRLIDPVKQKRS